jgi:hypothetical protein
MVETLLRAGVPAVVAMRYAVRDDLAAAFTKAFYQALISDQILDEAVVGGRQAIRAQPPLEKVSIPREWASPVLHLRCGDLVMFGRPGAADAHRQAGVAIQVGKNKRPGRVIGTAGPITAPVDLDVEKNAGLAAAGVIDSSVPTVPAPSGLDINVKVGENSGTVAGIVSGDAADEILRQMAKPGRKKEQKKQSEDKS